MAGDELIQRISLLPVELASSAGDSVFSAAQRKLIDEAYMTVFGKEIRRCSCRHRYADALIELCSTFKINVKMAQRHKYRLYGGVLIWIGNDCYSNANLTDEIAQRYLAMHPEAREKEFQLWPEEPEAEQATKEQEEDSEETEPGTAEEDIPEEPETVKTQKTKKGR